MIVAVIVPQVADQIRAILEQYDREDFDLGIKQFMLEAKVKAVRPRAGLLEDKHEGEAHAPRGV